MGLVGEWVTVNIGQLTGFRIRDAGARQAVPDYHRPTPVELRRPGRGTSSVEIHCGHCDAVLTVRVFSARRTLLARSRWVALLLFGLASIGAATHAAIAGHLDAVEEHAGILVRVLVQLTAVACAACSGVGLGLLALEHGVRLDAGSPAGIQHALLSHHRAVLGTITPDRQVYNIMGVPRRRRSGRGR